MKLYVLKNKLDNKYLIGVGNEWVDLEYARLYRSINIASNAAITLNTVINTTKPHSVLKLNKDAEIVVEEYNLNFERIVDPKLVSMERKQDNV